MDAISRAKWISYKGGYKYQLLSDCRATVGIYPARAIETRYISLACDGELLIKAGYAWDGPSGPSVHSHNFIRGSLIHDALYQLIRGTYLGTAERLHADEALRAACLEDGMSAVRAWWVFTAVRRFGGRSADAAASRRVIVSPRRR